MRTDSAIKNIKYMIITYGVMNLLKFLLRMIFVKTLPIGYLGINGLLSNFLAILSISEMGIGTAIVYSLYEPLACKNAKNIIAIMNLFKKTYRFIGFTIFALGLLLMQHLDFWIKDNIVDDLKWFFLIFLLDDAIGYFFSYKWTLLIADQKQFIYNKYHCYFQTIMIFLQMIFLQLSNSYWSFILIMFIGKLLENYWLSKKTEELYPFLKNMLKEELDIEIKAHIIRNTKALIINKMANVINNSSFNIIASKFIGLSVVGIYSNYALIINAIDTIGGQFFRAIAASIGNLLVVGESRNKLKVFNIIFFITAWQSMLLLANLGVCINQIIALWIGKEFLMSNVIVFSMFILFYLTYMQNAVRTFKEASGLYWEERYRPIIEVIVNIILAIILVQTYGVVGIIAASILSKIITSFWIEPYILFKKTISKSLQSYFKEYFKYILLTFFITIINKYIFEVFFYEVKLVSLILGIISCLIVSNLFWIILFRKTEEMIYLKTIVKNKISIK